MHSTRVLYSISRADSHRLFDGKTVRWTNWKHTHHWFHAQSIEGDNMSYHSGHIWWFLRFICMYEEKKNFSDEIYSNHHTNDTYLGIAAFANVHCVKSFQTLYAENFPLTKKKTFDKIETWIWCLSLWYGVCIFQGFLFASNCLFGFNSYIFALPRKENMPKYCTFYEISFIFSCKIT